MEGLQDTASRSPHRFAPGDAAAAWADEHLTPASGTQKQSGIVHRAPRRGGLDDPRLPGNTALGAVRKCGSGRSLGRDRQVNEVRGCAGLLAESDLTLTPERRQRTGARRRHPLIGNIGSSPGTTPSTVMPGSRCSPPKTSIPGAPQHRERRHLGLDPPRRRGGDRLLAARGHGGRRRRHRGRGAAAGARTVERSRKRGDAPCRRGLRRRPRLRPRARTEPSHDRARAMTHGPVLHRRSLIGDSVRGHSPKHCLDDGMVRQVLHALVQPRIGSGNRRGKRLGRQPGDRRTPHRSCSHPRGILVR